MRTHLQEIIAKFHFYPVIRWSWKQQQGEEEEEKERQQQ